MKLQNKYILAAMMSAGVIGTSFAQEKTEKTTIETDAYKLQEKKKNGEEKIKYEDDNFKYKEIDKKDGEVKIKSEGDPTQFNSLMNSADSSSASASIQKADTTGDFPPSPSSVQIINGTSEGYVNESVTADARSRKSPETGSVNYDGSGNVLSGSAKAGEGVPAGKYKYDSKGEKTSLKSPDGSKLKSSDKDFYYESGDKKTEIKSTPKETMIKEPGSKEVITKKEYKYENDSVKVDIKEKK